MQERLQEQFGLRAARFDASAAWITDPDLLGAHVALAGKPSGEALDLCCGTGRMGRALQAAGWTVHGLDITPGMAAISSKYFPVRQGPAENIPYESARFRIVLCRQSFQFLDVPQVLSEIARILAPGGSLVTSLTVPFSDADAAWLKAIHLAKQPLLRQFYTRETLDRTFADNGFSIAASQTLRVRESITRWMDFAPELTQEARAKVLSMVREAPPEYRDIRKVETTGREVFEDWHWVVLRAIPNRAASSRNDGGPSR